MRERWLKIRITIDYVHGIRHVGDGLQLRELRLRRATVITDIERPALAEFMTVAKERRIIHHPTLRDVAVGADQVDTFRHSGNKRKSCLKIYGARHLTESKTYVLIEVIIAETVAQVGAEYLLQMFIDRIEYAVILSW